jgi:predicted transcriptional regulator
MLQILGDEAKRRTEWTVAAREKGISTNQFNLLLTELLEGGFVKRLNRGVYERTESGKELQAELEKEIPFLSSFRCDKMMKKWIRRTSRQN